MSRGYTRTAEVARRLGVRGRTYPVDLDLLKEAGWRPPVPQERLSDQGVHIWRRTGIHTLPGGGVGTMHKPPPSTF